MPPRHGLTISGSGFEGIEKAFQHYTTSCVLCGQKWADNVRSNRLTDTGYHLYGY
jgi:hypothetical protein